MINNGVDPTRKRATLLEKVAAMRALWSEELVAYDGEFVRFSPSWSLPTPAQRPGPKVHLGCAPTVRNLADVASMADGFVPMQAMLDGDAASVITKLRRRLEDAGRDPESIDISVVHTGTSWGRTDADKFSRRLPSPADLAAYQALGVARVIVSIPIGDNELAERAPDAWHERTLQLA
jgi:alkanesulfonate monooxygenase SsuD/methylene tetrahydromethanopterin reductase-like flavin-dependent oxidoreductase (luciferase family)